MIHPSHGCTGKIIKICTHGTQRTSALPDGQDLLAGIKLNPPPSFSDYGTFTPRHNMRVQTAIIFCGCYLFVAFGDLNKTCKLLILMVELVRIELTTS
jgi:hypothetical protein